MMKKMNDIEIVDHILIMKPVWILRVLMTSDDKNLLKIPHRHAKFYTCIRLV